MSGTAYVDDLEGSLYSQLREHQKSEPALRVGALEGGSKLLVSFEGQNSAYRLRVIVSEALRRCAEEWPEARFAVGPITLAKSGTKAIEDVVAGLDDEIRILENGYHLPQPVAVALRALDGATTARPKPVLELGEALLQWVALCSAAELGINESAARTTTPLRRNLAEGATAEHWLEVLAIGIEEILNCGATPGTASSS